VPKVQIKPHRPVYPLGVADANGQGGSVYEWDDMTCMYSRDAAPRLWSRTGLRPSDMDLALMYDCYTYTVMATLEDFGFCKKGEGGPFVEGGKRIEIGGEIPIVTHGGCHAHCHPGLPSGIFHIIEAVKQLRGEVEGPRQVEGAKSGLINGLGGNFSAHTALILGTD